MTSSTRKSYHLQWYTCTSENYFHFILSSFHVSINEDAMGAAKMFKGFLKLCNIIALIAIAIIVLFDVKLNLDENELNGFFKTKEHHIARRQVSAGSGGATYIRWGRKSCGSEEVELVYAGVVGGSLYSNTGGGSNYLCLPMDPHTHDDGINLAPYTAQIYGAEYQLYATNEYPFSHGNADKLYDHDPPCAVCHMPSAASVIMIPARTECYAGWRVMYSGHLVAENQGHSGRTEFVCMDQNPEADTSGYSNDEGVLFYPAVAKCGSLPCPPYVEERALACVVCAK